MTDCNRAFVPSKRLDSRVADMATETETGERRRAIWFASGDRQRQSSKAAAKERGSSVLSMQGRTARRSNSKEGERERD